MPNGESTNVVSRLMSTLKVIFFSLGTVQKSENNMKLLRKHVLLSPVAAIGPRSTYKGDLISFRKSLDTAYTDTSANASSRRGL